MNALPTAKTKAAQVIVSLKDTLSTFVSPGIDPEQYIASAIAEVNMLRMQFSDEQLSDPRTVESIVKAVFNGAVVGLLLGPALGHSYLVGYVRHRGQKGEYAEIQFMPGYKGMLECPSANWPKQRRSRLCGNSPRPGRCVLSCTSMLRRKNPSEAYSCSQD